MRGSCFSLSMFPCKPLAPCGALGGTIPTVPGSWRHTVNPAPPWVRLGARGGRFAPGLLACGPWCTPSRSLVHTCAVRGWPEMILPLNTPAHHEGSNPYKNPTIEMTTACSSAAVRPCHPVTQLAELTRSSSWPQAPLHFFLPAAELHFFLPAGGLPKPSHRSTFWPAYVPPLASPCKIGVALILAPKQASCQ